MAFIEPVSRYSADDPVCAQFSWGIDPEFQAQLHSEIHVERFKAKASLQGLSHKDR